MRRVVIVSCASILMLVTCGSTNHDMRPSGPCRARPLTTGEGALLVFLVDDCVGIRAAGGRVVVALESTTAPRNTDDYYFFYLRSSGYMPKTSATDTIGYLAVSKRAASVYDAVTMKEEHGADLDAAVDIVRNAACIGAAELKAFGGRPLYRATPTNGKR